MKTEKDFDLKKQMNDCILHINTIMNQLEPSERLKFMNELILRIMPGRKKPSSAADKIEKKQQAAPLSQTQLKLIKNLSDATDRLFDMDGGDHRA